MTVAPPCAHAATEALVYAAATPSGVLHRADGEPIGRERALCGYAPRHGWFISQPNVDGLRNRRCRRCAEREGMV